MDYKRACYLTDFHGIFSFSSCCSVADAYDYQGRPFLHIPQDLDIDLTSEEPPEKCYLPKKRIHTWYGQYFVHKLILLHSLSTSTFWSWLCITYCSPNTLIYTHILFFFFKDWSLERSRGYSPVPNIWSSLVILQHGLKDQGQYTRNIQRLSFI